MKKAGTQAIAAILLHTIISRMIRYIQLLLLGIILIATFGIYRCLNASVITTNLEYQPIAGKQLDYTIMEVKLPMWHAKPIGGYSIYDPDCIENAYMILNQMRAAGWTTESISAVIGNMCAEGAMNPWRWQSDIIVGPSDFWSNQHGYGLAGFTPAGKYIEDTQAQTYAGYAPNYLGHAGNATDGAAQIQFIMDNPQYYQTHTAYPLTFTEFSQSTAAPSYLSDVWLYNFEQPADPSATQQYRRDCSDYWYQLFQGAPYFNPDDIIPCLIAMKVIK